MKKFSRSQKKNFLKKLPLGLAVVFFLIVAGVIAWQYRADLAAKVYDSRRGFLEPLSLPFITRRQSTRATITAIPPNEDAGYKSFVQITQQPIITRKSTVSTIRVTLPNQDAANQSFVQGTQQLITWKSTGSIIPPLTISLHSASKPASYNVKPPLTGQPVSGDYQWNVPSDISGSNYYINVMGKNSSGGKVNGQSQFFNIVTQSSAAGPR